jgi:hypothetical protein
MTRALITLTLFCMVLALAMVTVAKPLFSIYSEYILAGNYVGETYAVYFFDFILYCLSPSCMILSILLVTLYYKHRGKR